MDLAGSPSYVRHVDVQIVPTAEKKKKTKTKTEAAALLAWIQTDDHPSIARLCHLHVQQ